MSDFASAITLICKYEGFNEKAYPDPTTGAEPYTIGFGTQFYPDGSPVKKGQCCSKTKALEYLFHETQVIDTQLTKLNLGLDDYMRQALISFIHSIGWEAFLYSSIVDDIEREDLKNATLEIGNWIFDEHHQVVGGLLDRRREEISLFLSEVEVNPWASTEILLSAFRNYTAAPHEVRAIRTLEEKLNPYLLTEFANNFCINESSWIYADTDEFDFIYNA
jgi:lysozyme